MNNCIYICAHVVGNQWVVNAAASLPLQHLNGTAPIAFGSHHTFACSRARSPASRWYSIQFTAHLLLRTRECCRVPVNWIIVTVAAVISITTLLCCHRALLCRHRLCTHVGFMARQSDFTICRPHSGAVTLLWHAYTSSHCTHHSAINKPYMLYATCHIYTQIEWVFMRVHTHTYLLCECVCVCVCAQCH